MVEWPRPQSIRKLRGFLGLTRYHRRFIKRHGITSKPLTALLKKNNFGWNKKADEAFQTLKTAMTQAPILTLPNFSKPFTPEMDACETRVGAILTQDGRPMAFLSQALAPKHLGLSIYDKELIAVLMVVDKWRYYMEGNSFVIKTDHESLKFLTQQTIHTQLQRKGVTKLLGLDYTIQYRKGKENKVVDALSRKEEWGSCQAISVARPKCARHISQL